MKEKFVLELEWMDESNVQADILLDGSWHEKSAVLMWICRGSLVASSARYSTIWNDEGFEVCKYQQ